VVRTCLAVRRVCQKKIRDLFLPCCHFLAEAQEISHVAWGLHIPLCMHGRRELPGREKAVNESPVLGTSETEEVGTGLVIIGLQAPNCWRADRAIDIASSGSSASRPGVSVRVPKGDAAAYGRLDVQNTCR
jgi:hypothetical protein